MLRQRWQYWSGLAEHLGFLVTQRLHDAGYSWADAARALLVLSVWTALLVGGVFALLGVLHGA